MKAITELMICKTPFQHSKGESNSATCQMATISMITDTVSLNVFSIYIYFQYKTL